MHNFLWNRDMGFIQVGPLKKGNNLDHVCDVLFQYNQLTDLCRNHHLENGYPGLWVQGSCDSSSMHQSVEYLQALLTPGVFSSAHFIPYIFMEWSEIAGPLRSSLCPDLDDLIDLLKNNGYTARDARTLRTLPDSCLQNPVPDVMWVHGSAIHIWL